MAFTAIGQTAARQEGGRGLFQAGRKSVLLIWPKGAPNPRLFAGDARLPRAETRPCLVEILRPARAFRIKIKAMTDGAK